MISFNNLITPVLRQVLTPERVREITHKLRKPTNSFYLFESYNRINARDLLYWYRFLYNFDVTAQNEIRYVTRIFETDSRILLRKGLVSKEDLWLSYYNKAYDYSEFSSIYNLLKRYCPEELYDEKDIDKSRMANDEIIKPAAFINHGKNQEDYINGDITTSDGKDGKEIKNEKNLKIDIMRKAFRENYYFEDSHYIS